MSLWIKVCGNTTLEDALLAAEAGADAVGFVFAPSPRQVTFEEVQAISSRLPQSVERIGVFVDSTLDEIDAAINDCRLNGVQMHFDADPDLPEKLRERHGPDLRILRVLHYGEGAGALASTLVQEKNIDAVLVDSRTPTAVGGTGLAFDWNSAGSSLFRNPGIRGRLVVAGGLTLENVSEAIAKLHPWGVDVVSGVEAAPGRKDPDKVRNFVAAAQAAASRL